jgi:hypothetical protein
MPFPDPIPLPGWNHDWTTDDAWVYAAYDSKAANVYADAINERYQASVDVGVTPPSTGHLVPHDATFSRRLNFPVYNPSGREMRAMGSNGTAINYTGTFDLSITDYDGRDFPVRRRYPRWIDNLASTGDQEGAIAVDGQKAMLVGPSSVNGSNTGKYFTRTSGAWVYDPAVTAPDKVIAASSTGTNITAGGGVFAPQAGDYFCAEFLNESRDRLNSQVMFTGAISTWDNTSRLGFGEDTTYAGAVAAAQADYNSPTNTTNSDTTAGPSVLVEYFPPASGFGHIIHVAKTYCKTPPVIDNLPMAGICNFQVYQYSGSSGPPDWDPSNPDIDRQFKDFGDPAFVDPGLISGGTTGPDTPGDPVIVKEYFTSSITTASSIASASFSGSNCPTTPWPSSTNGGRWGYSEVYIGNLFTRYDVTGGFQYTR